MALGEDRVEDDAPTDPAAPPVQDRPRLRDVYLFCVDREEDVAPVDPDWPPVEDRPRLRWAFLVTQYIGHTYRARMYEAFLAEEATEFDAYRQCVRVEQILDTLSRRRYEREADEREARAAGSERASSSGQ